MKDNFNPLQYLTNLFIDVLGTSVPASFGLAVASSILAMLALVAVVLGPLYLYEKHTDKED